MRAPMPAFSIRHALEFGRETVHASRTGRRDLDSFGEYAARSTLAPLRIEEIDVEREHHAWLEAIADNLDRFAIGSNRMMAKTGIFQRCQAVAVDAGFANRQAASVDLIFHRHKRSR